MDDFIESMNMKTNLNIHASGSQISAETSNTSTYDLLNNNVRNEFYLYKISHSPTSDNCSMYLLGKFQFIVPIYFSSYMEHKHENLIFFFR